LNLQPRGFEGDVSPSWGACEGAGPLAGAARQDSLPTRRRLDGSIPLASSTNSADDSTSLRLTAPLLSPRNSATVTATVTVCCSK